MSKLIAELIDSFCCLPGVGPKSAQRMAFYLLGKNRKGAEKLFNSIQRSLLEIKHCKLCRNFSEYEICELCKNPARDRKILCIVETPADVVAIEQASVYKGIYFVLMGRLSPLDGIGPNDIGLNQLKQQIETGELEEIILATNPTIEGEATAQYISNMVVDKNIVVTRIAHGVPLGGELEYIDSGTLMQALSKRMPVDYKVL